MSAKPRIKAQQPAHGTQKSRREYVDRLERALRDYTAEADGDGREGNTHKRDRREKEKKEQQKGRDKGPGRGKVLNVLDKMRGGFGNTEQQEATRERLQQYEKEKRKLQAENENLTQIAEHVQERACINAQRFTEEIASLQAELESAQLARMSGIANLTDLQETSLRIRDDILSLRGVAEQQAAEDIRLMEDAFAKQIRAKVEEVEREKHSRKNKTGEWIGKNKILQQEVDKQMQLTEAKHAAAKKLKETRKLLSVEHAAQLGDKEILIRQSLSLQAHNKRLRERSAELEGIIHALQTTMLPDRSPLSGAAGSALSRGSVEAQQRMQAASGPHGAEGHSDLRPTHTTEERIARYEQALAKFKIIVAAEKKNLEAVRSAHVQALQQRTELEVLLKDALHWGIEEAKKRPHATGDDGLPVLTEEDRRDVIEMLLSNDRVLQLLYGKDTVGDDSKASADAQLPAVNSDIDMTELWEKWKTWTETTATA